MNLILIATLLSLGCVKGQFFEDRRCRCVCPNPASVVNTTATRQIFTGNVPPNKCHCEGVVFPLLRKELEGKLHIFCPRCECTFQTRNTTLIMAVVLLTITTIAMAILYLVSLKWLKTLLNWNNQGQRGTQDENGRVQRDPRHEVDYVRTYRGEYERERNRQVRDLSPESEEEGLLNWDEDD